MSELRAWRLIDAAIAELGVALDGLVVYTEAASGPYLWTSLLAARAGAERVYALAGDTRHHRAADVAAATRAAADRAGLAERVHVVQEKRPAELAEADIVTNSATLRPIAAADVAALKPTAVIPLMWETWEFNPADLDLAACRSGGIVVLGTHECRPPCDLRPYLGFLAVRVLFALGFEGARTAVTVLGGQVLAREIERFLRAAGCPVERYAAPWDGLRVTGDALLVAEASDQQRLIGPGGVLAVEDVPPATRIGVIIGDVDAAALRATGRIVFPDCVRGGGRMSFDISALGPRPVLELYAAGLRVGAVSTRARLAGATPEEAVAVALADGVAMDF